MEGSLDVVMIEQVSISPRSTNASLLGKAGIHHGSLPQCMGLRGIVRATSLGQPSHPLTSGDSALNTGLLGFGQAGRDSRRQQPAEEDYQISLV